MQIYISNRKQLRKWINWLLQKLLEFQKGVKNYAYILSPMYDINLLHTFGDLLLLTILMSIVYKKRLSKSTKNKLE